MSEQDAKDLDKELKENVDATGIEVEIEGQRLVY